MAKTAALPGPITLAKEAVHYYRLLFWSFFALYSLYFLSIIIVLIISVLLAFILNLLFGRVASEALSFFGILYLFAFVIFVIYLSMILNASQVVLVSTSEKYHGVKELIKSGRLFIVPLLVTSLLSGVIIFGGSLMFIIPGIIIGIWFSFASFIVVTEKVRGWNALYKSREYYKGRFWQILWRGIAIYIPFYLLSFLVMLLQNEENEAVLSSTLQLASFALGPLYFIYFYRLYHAVKQRSERVTEAPSSFKRIFTIIAVLGLLLALIGIWYLINFVSGMPAQTLDGATITYLLYY